MTLEQEENAGMLISEKYDHLISSNDLECPIHFPMKRLIVCVTIHIYTACGLSDQLFWPEGYGVQA